MARPKGLPKTGGRKAGSPNKLTNELRDALGEVLYKQITPRKLNTLLRSLKPMERINALTKLLRFTLPELQSIDVKTQVTEEFKAMENLLRTAPEEAIAELEKRFLDLENKLKDNEPD